MLSADWLYDKMIAFGCSNSVQHCNYRSPIMPAPFTSSTDQTFVKLSYAFHIDTQ
jgi:hypothetical protein